MTKTTQAAKRRIHPDVLTAIVDRLANHMTAADIVKDLDRDKAFVGYRIPSERTVQRISAETTHAQAGGKIEDGAWLWYKEEPAKAKVIMESLYGIQLATHGAVSRLTTNQADMIYRIRTVAPGVKPAVAYMIAYQLLAQLDRGESVDEITTYLTFDPDLDENRTLRFLWAEAKGFINAYTPPAPVVDEIKRIDQEAGVRHNDVPTKKE